MVDGSYRLHIFLVWTCMGGFTMKTIEQLRNKHWSARNTLWPRTHIACDVRFNWQGFHINRKALQVAQDEARDAVATGEQKYWNRGNYFLTGAYMGGQENEQFWSQEFKV